MGEYFTVYEFTSINRVFLKGQVVQALDKWKIKDADELKKMIRMLLDPESEMNVEYKELHGRLFALSHSARSQYIESRKDHDDYAKLVMVNLCLHQLPSGDISGYGAAWAIALSRIGECKGWLTKEEAWRFKLEGARLAQSSSDSWGDFFTSNCIGIHFDQQNPEIKKTMYVNGSFTLLRSSSQPYKKAVWNTDLAPDLNEVPPIDYPDSVII